MRMGHFLAQWGPEAIQLGENIVQGSDGQLYKGRAIPPGAVAKKPDPCDPCNCNTTDAQVKKTSSPVSRQASFFCNKKKEKNKDSFSFLINSVSHYNNDFFL